MVLYPTVVGLSRGTEGSSHRGLIIRLIIQMIRQDPSRSAWIDDAPNLSRPDPSGAIQIDAEHPSRNRKLVGRLTWPRARPIRRRWGPAGLAGDGRVGHGYSFAWESTWRSPSC